jgi:hypothetical protein
MDEARIVCDYIEGRGTREEFLAKFAVSSSPGFDPDVHLRRIGVANQTTMLAKESLAIGEEVGQAIARARGDEARASDFRTFDTICSATQERQDACQRVARGAARRDVVIGGFNSSNTISLAALCTSTCRRTTSKTHRASILRRARCTIARRACTTSKTCEPTGSRPRARYVLASPLGEHAEQQDRRDGIAHSRNARLGVRSSRSVMLPYFTHYVALGDSVSIDLYPALDAGEIDVAVALERDPPRATSRHSAPRRCSTRTTTRGGRRIRATTSCRVMPASRCRISPPMAPRSATCSASSCRSSSRMRTTRSSR